MKKKVKLALMMLTLTVVSCSYSSKIRKAKKYQNLGYDDARITTDLRTKLLKSTKTSGWNVSVEAYNGVVILSGFVDSRSEKDNAIEIARNTNGVVEIRDALLVKEEFSE